MIEYTWCINEELSVTGAHVTFQQKKSCDFEAPENNQNVESQYFFIFSNESLNILLRKRKEKTKLKNKFGY